MDIRSRTLPQLVSSNRGVSLNKRQWPVQYRLALVVASVLGAGGLVASTPSVAAQPNSEVTTVRDDRGRVRAVHPAAQQVIKPKQLNGKTPATPAEAARSHLNQYANMF